MAEIVLSPLVEAALGTLRSLLAEEIRVIRGVEEDLKSLSNTLSTIQSVVADAEERQLQSVTIKDWLRKLKDVLHDAEDVVDEFSLSTLQENPVGESQSKMRKQVLTLCFCFTISKKVAFRHNMGYGIQNLRKRLDEIAKDRTQFHLLETTEARPFRNTRYASPLIDASLVLGRESEKDEILSKLLNESSIRLPSVIVVVGLGGLGKTTLARLVYNSRKAQERFQVRGWVCVSDRFEMRRVTKEIVDSITGGKDCVEAQPEIQLKNLVEGKRSLIVLDDVWDDIIDYWDDFVVPFAFGGKGSKIIITTRSENVSKVRGISTSYRLKNLSDEDGLELFTRRVFVDGEKEKFPNLVDIGKKIVKKCKGVPLAVNTLSGLLMDTRSESRWKNVLTSSFWKLPQNENSILPALKLSYHHLPAKVKPCFAFCALFPKDFEFDKNELIRMWMAQGYLQSDEWREKEDEGEDCFNELVMRSFFTPQYSDRDIYKCTMHDLVHDLAESLAKEECMRLHDGKDLIHPENAFLPRARHALLHFSMDAEEVGFEELRSYKSLHTLIIRHETPFFECRRSFLEEEQERTPEMKFLRVLSLKYIRIFRLPDFISSLRLLQYLDLSNSKIEEVPDSICSLLYLQTLDVHSCEELKKVSSNIATHLINLRYFNIVGCESLNSMPPHIGKLTKLKAMPWFIVGKEVGEKIAELKEINRLKGHLTIRRLGNVGNGEEAKDADLKNKELTSLVLEWTPILVENVDKSSIDEEVLANLQPHINLKHLKVYHYWGSYLPSWFCHLPLLEFLELIDCPNLAFLPDGLEHLVSLERLVLYYCPKLSFLPDGLGNLISLKELRLSRCPRIGSLPSTGLPKSLEKLTINWCSLLERSCRKGDGSDWPKIEHIPLKFIDGLE